MTNELRINQDIQLDPRVYVLSEGITIDADNMTLDGRGATIMGIDKTGQGINVSGRKNISIKNLRVMNYYHGISIKKSTGIEISNCTITSLPFDDFLEPSVRTTQTRLKSFELNKLMEQVSVKAILEGLLEGGDFLLKE